MPKQHIDRTADQGSQSDVSQINQLVRDFCSTLRVVNWKPPAELLRATRRAIEECGPENILDASSRKRFLLGLVNSKFGLNDARHQEFIDQAASLRMFLNYHDKQELRDCLDHGDHPRLHAWLVSRGFDEDLLRAFRPIEPGDTVRLLTEQLRAPQVARRDARDCDPAERRESILRALFGGFVFVSFPRRLMHSYLNPDCKIEYTDDFFQHMQRFHPTVLNRRCALLFTVIGSEERVRLGPGLRNALFGLIEDAYSRLSNHCYFSVLIKPFQEDGEDGQWKLFSDLTIYAEKFRESLVTTGYFHPEKIASDTHQHMPHLSPDQGRFEVANEGFIFRDCFVLSSIDADEVKTTHSTHDLLLTFEKNERDETSIPCPTCRSLDVRGNSYPTLGVKSWECQSPICPERSAFDRGKRYSVSALIKQEAIKSEHDQIPETSLRKWKLDVVTNASQETVVDMLLRHYSLHRDTVVFVNTSGYGEARFGRKIIYETLASSSRERAKVFGESVFFSRFAVDRPEGGRKGERIETSLEDVALYQGDSFEVLASLDAESVDGAVTSPPYYNARSYSTWPNIYCYLHDMYNNAKQVFRALRNGAYYLFNIFDYFDNENTIALSAMGKKRMILGAYIVNLFRRIGFVLEGNCIWYKGEIEGKRNFNQGNRSPYYQFPFNCWEHVLVFRKPGGRERLEFPSLLATRPVFKMVRGENKLGHSAPFPSAIPELLVSRMKPGETILDPFSGSMTTGRTAHRHQIRSISIELHREYCDLGLKLLRNDDRGEQLSLLDLVG